MAVGDDLSISPVNYVVGFLCRSIEWDLWFRATSIYASVYTPSIPLNIRYNTPRYRPSLRSLDLRSLDYSSYGDLSETDVQYTWRVRGNSRKQEDKVNTRHNWGDYVVAYRGYKYTYYVQVGLSATTGTYPLMQFSTLRYSQRRNM